ncbi:CCA tRNA nucleotidyltransferase [Chloroflexota bacterium]
MSEIVNLTNQVKAQLPTELIAFMQLAGEVAHRSGKSLYLVGGVVRDLLLERSNLDLDLVTEGDAIGLAHELAGIREGKVVTHPSFGTAGLRWDKWSVDIATARLETYTRPGALPKVKPNFIKGDLFRRDFTINAMAVALAPDHYGELIDLYGGREDLERGFIRVLHEKSFVDDATRIWRGLRYEQRLCFQLEPVTLELLKQSLSMLDTISGERIRHELELVLEEEFPEKVLCRAGELGVLAKVHSSLKGDNWLADKFARARLAVPDASPVVPYLALLAYRLTEAEVERFISYLRLPKSSAEVLRDTVDIKIRLELLDIPELTSNGIYALLHGYVSPAITANSLVTDSPVIKERIDLFLKKLRHIKPALSGGGLKRMGIAEGPRIKEILNMLRAARLDGKVCSRKDEEGLVEGWLAQEEV